jgi:hypothetical protein
MRVVFPHVLLPPVSREFDSVAAELAVPRTPLAYFRTGKALIEPMRSRLVFAGTSFPLLLDAYRSAEGLAPDADVNSPLINTLLVLAERSVVKPYRLHDLLLCDSLPEVRDAAIPRSSLGPYAIANPSDLLLVPHPEVVERLCGSCYLEDHLVGGRVERTNPPIRVSEPNSLGSIPLWYSSLPKNRIH